MKKITNNTGKITAIYVRRSVSDKDKGNNSLSIAAQKEECVKYVGEGAEYRIYCDDGKSAKDTLHRPSFQQMMTDARNGEISRIIVKKYDRFSRNMREYLNVTDELDKYGVGVFSLSEPFNTETKEGRMMRNNLLNFAEFERETIAGRVADAYNTKARETGFYQGGKQYYGFVSERRTINGKTGSVLVPTDKAEVIRVAYDIYKEPAASLADIINYCIANGIDMNIEHRDGTKSNMDRSHLSRLLASPLYVRADSDIYKYYASQGVEMLDDVSEYNGVYGLFLHSNADGTRFIKLGYHEGLVDSETWLAVQDKKSHNHKIPTNKDNLNSWLVGLMKCGNCGNGLIITYGWNVSHTIQYRYLLDSGAYRADGCVKKRLKTRVNEVEERVFEAMKERISDLEIARKNSGKRDTAKDGINAEILRIDDEIRSLMDKLAAADEVLFDYIQKRIKELHTKKSELETKLRTHERKHKIIDTAPLSAPLARWDELTVWEKHEVAATMINTVYISDNEGIDIKFAI